MTHSMSEVGSFLISDYKRTTNADILQHKKSSKQLKDVDANTSRQSYTCFYGG